MKRRIAVLLLAVLLLACVPTPETEYVVNKSDQNTMIEASRTEEAFGNTDLRTMYHIPERMTGRYSSADGAVEVTVDADIIVPEGPLPILRVYAAEFEQPTVTALWNELVKDAVLYDQWENGETKADLEKEMKSCSDLIDRIQSGELSEDDSMYTLDELREMIAEMQERYPNAPDAFEKAIETGVLHKQYLSLGDDKKAASQMGISARMEGEPWMQFHVENDTDNTEMLIHREKDGWSGIEVRRAARFYFNRSSVKMDCFYAVYVCDYAELYPVDADDPIPKAAAGNLTMTPTEAYAEIERFMKEIGIVDTYAISRAVVAGDSTEADAPSEEFGYCFELVRKIGGATCNRSLMDTSASRTSADEYAPSWSYENFLIALDDSGIYYVTWSAPFTVGDTINENAKLLDFSEIQKTAERMLPMQEVQNFQPEYSKKADRTVDRIELGLWRVAEQNELGKGLLVPAYCFYGTDHFTRVIKDGPHDLTDESYRSSILLIVNAIDGSLIDPAKGY